MTQTEGTHDGEISLRVTFGCDALDGNWPYVVAREVTATPQADLDAILRSRLPDAPDDDLDSLSDCLPLRDLLHLVLSAILYATSVDARKGERPSSSRTSSSAPTAREVSSESVFHLAGTIAPSDPTRPAWRE